MENLPLVKWICTVEIMPIYQVIMGARNKVDRMMMLTFSNKKKKKDCHEINPDLWLHNNIIYNNT